MTKINATRRKAQEIIAYLNDKAGRRFKLVPKHMEFIRRRFNEGFELDDFKLVIDNMVRVWANDPKMYKYLRPETLFGNKFDGYLNLPPPPKKPVDGIRPVQTLDKDQLRSKVCEQFEFVKSEIESGEYWDGDWLHMAVGKLADEYEERFGESPLAQDQKEFLDNYKEFLDNFYEKLGGV